MKPFRAIAISLAMGIVLESSAPVLAIDEIVELIGKARALNRSADANERQNAGKLLNDAVEAWTKKTVNAPTDAPAFYGLARLCTELSRDKDAVDAINQAVSLAPNQPEYLNQQVTALLYTNAYAEALAPAKRLVELAPDKPEYAQRLATIYLETFDTEAAYQTYRKLLATLPPGNTVEQSSGFRVNYAYAARRAGKYDDAIRVLDSLVAADPQNVGLRLELGICFEAKGELDKAAEEYSSALRAKPDAEETIGYLAAIAAQKNQPEQVARYREQLFELHKAKRTQSKSFKREAFKVGDRYRVRAYELYELVGPQALRYQFVVEDNTRKEPLKISLGSYDLTTAVMRGTGTIASDQRAWHLDLYDGPRHETYGMFTSEPSYAETRAIVIGVLEGTRPAISASTRPEKPNEPATIELPSESK
jgi:Flp pilus assembly protein TadD